MIQIVKINWPSRQERCSYGAILKILSQSYWIKYPNVRENFETYWESTIIHQDHISLINLKDLPKTLQPIFIEEFS